MIDLSPLDPMRAAIVRFALEEVLECEVPALSNRSPAIDQWCRLVGSPVASYWCGAFAAACWRAGGAVVPPLAGSVQAWVSWGRSVGRWRARAPGVVPQAGDAVVYDFAGDGRADHIGIIARVEPVLCSIEGNTTTGATRNGEGVFAKIVPPACVMGYVSPLATADMARMLTNATAQRSGAAAGSSTAVPPGVPHAAPGIAQDGR